MDTDILKDIQNITESQNKLNEEYINLRDFINKKLGIDNDSREQSSFDELNEEVNKNKENIEKNTKDIKEQQTVITSLKKTFNDIKKDYINFKNSFKNKNNPQSSISNKKESEKKTQDKESITSKGLKIAQNEFKNTNKERKVVSEKVPVIVQSFGEKAINTLENIFKKTFKIQIVQPKDEIKKKSKLWLLALAGVVSLIIANFDKIKKWITSIDWKEIWNDIKKELVGYLKILSIALLKGIGSAFTMIKDGFISLVNSDEIQSAFKTIKEKLNPLKIIEPFKNFIIEIFTKSIPDSFKSTINGIKQFISKVFNWINSIFGWTHFKSDSTPEAEVFDPDKVDEEESNNNANTIDDIDYDEPADNLSTESSNIKTANENTIINQNINAFNNITEGKQEKALMINEGNRTTIFPLNGNDQAIILKENGIIDNKLSTLISVITNKSKEYCDKFKDISDSIESQTNSIKNIIENQKNTINNNFQNVFNDYDKIINQKIIIATKQSKPPVVSVSNISKKQQACLNNA